MQGMRVRVPSMDWRRRQMRESNGVDERKKCALGGVRKGERRRTRRVPVKEMWQGVEDIAKMKMVMNYTRCGITENR